MKLFALLTGLICSTAFASDCQNFAGTYQWAQNPAEITLTATQTACSSVTFNYLYPANGETIQKTFVTDGQRRQTSDDQTQTVYETAKMVGSQMTNYVEFFTKATGQTTTALSTFEIDANGNLDSTDQYYDATGKPYSSDTNDFNKSKQ